MHEKRMRHGQATFQSIGRLEACGITTGFTSRLLLPRSERLCLDEVGMAGSGTSLRQTNGLKPSCGWVA